MDSSQSSGTIVRDFISVRVASIRSSGIAAARHLSPDGTLTKKNPTLDSLQDQLKQGNTNASFSGCDSLKEQERFMDESNKRIRNSRVRRLFGGGTDEIVETSNKTCNAMKEEMDFPILSDHAVASLSYVESEELGEQMQQHALDIVDKIVLMNDVEQDGEANPLQSVIRNSPPLLRATGAHSMSTRVNPQSPLGKEGIYDWIDSREDDRGGHFFSKRKDVLLEGIETNDATSKTLGSCSNLKGKGEVMKHQSLKKQRGLSHLVPGFKSCVQINSAKVGGCGIELQKNLFKETAEQPSKEFCKYGSDTNAINGDSEDISDVGINTQLAAEALESLACGSRAGHDFRNAQPVTTEITKDSKTDLTENKDQQKCAATKKRVHSSSSHYSCRKRLKSSSEKDFRRNSPEQTRLLEKMEHESFMNTGNCANGNVSGKPSNLDKGGHVEASTVIHLKDVAEFSNIFESNTHLSNKKGHEKHFNVTVTPVAHQTRQSITREISFTTHACKRMTTNRHHSKMGPDHVPAAESEISQFDMGRVECGSHPKRMRTCQNLSDNSTLGTLDAKKSKLRSTSLAVGDAMSNFCSIKSNNLHDFAEVGSSIMPVKNAGHGNLERPLKESGPYPGSVSSPPSEYINAMSPICSSDGPQDQLGKNGLLRSRIAKELHTADSSRGRTLSSKIMCQSREMASVRVLFSHHLDKDLLIQQKKILEQMRGSIASSPSDATHFIADEFVRTRNMLETMALGKTVVTHLWLENCAQAGCYIDEKKYILRDSKMEMKIGFNMPVSLAHACCSTLLLGKRVFITQNVKPNKEVIASLVKAVHGQAIERVGRSSMKDNKIRDNLLVISCEEDYSICEPLLERGAEVYSSELLLNGIVIQKLEYGRHRLFMDHVKRTRSTIWLRKGKEHQFRPVAKC